MNEQSQIVKILREFNYITIENQTVVKLYDVTKKINELQREEVKNKLLLRNIT